MRLPKNFNQSQCAFSMIPKLARAHALGIRETFNVEPFKQNVFPVANDLKILRGAMRPDFILL